MAGFGFTVEFDSSTRELMRRLLGHLQRRARYYALELHFQKARRWDEYMVSVDGPLRGMQAFAPRMALEALVCAEFSERPKPAWRRTDVAHDLVYGYYEGLHSITRAVLRMHRTLRQTVPPGGVPSVPSLVFDDTDLPSHLLPAIRRFEATLAVYANLPAMLLPMLPVEEEQVVEEAHTATELLMRAAVGREGPRFSYAQMAAEVQRRGWLSQEQHDKLIELKQARRGVKHRGQSVKTMGGYELVMNAVNCCHQLVARVAGRAW